MPEYEVIHAKSPVFYERFERKSELQQQTHYCPGCGHGIAHKLVAEAIEELGLQERTVLVSPVGCSVFAYYYFDVGNVQAAHGRAPAVATGLKRSRPESIVIAYQGDGDLAAIGTAEIVHAANRGEKIAVFFINNAIYGMTGGQMAPTTLVGQTSTTSPWGRRVSNEGYPLHMAELLATLEAPVYIERAALCDNKNIMRARRAVRKALELQREGAGFTMVEILSPCPTIWKKTAVEAQRWVAEAMLPIFPLGVYRDRKAAPVTDVTVPRRSVAEVLELADKVGAPSHEGGTPLPNRNAASVADELELRAKEGWDETVTMKVAGLGGQGVLLAGLVLAEAGMREGREVSWLPSYGPEMRSGSAHCHVCLSGKRIGSPLVDHPDVLVAMNEISLRKFAPDVAPGGLILYNREALPGGFAPRQARVVCVAGSEIADGMGAPKAANMVMVGALVELTGALKMETVIQVLESEVHNAALLEADRRALEAGRAAARRQKGFCG